MSAVFQGLTQSQVIQGTVVDVDGHPIPGVRYFLKSKPDQKAVTDRDGKFKRFVAEPDSLIFQSVAFENNAVYISSKMLNKAAVKGKLNLTVEMKDKTLPVAYITPKKPDTLVGTQEYYVSDFAFDASGYLVLLTYEQNLRRGAEVRLFDEKMKEVDYFKIPGKAIELKNDWRRNVHLITEEDVFWFDVVDGRFKIYLEDRDEYYRNIQPIIDTIERKVYYSNYSENYPAFDYYEYNLNDSLHNILLTVEDSETMEFYRAEFKYLDNRGKVMMADLEYETGIDREIWAGALYYTKTIYYNPIYAPLFKVNDDTILIFDHYKNLMFNYSAENGIVDSTRISYHMDSKRSGWSQPLIQDPVTRKIYVMYERSGYTYLSELDRTNGQVVNSYRLFFKYVEELQIINGNAHYIYRPFESIQRKYLYKEELKPSDL